MLWPHGFRRPGSRIRRSSPVAQQVLRLSDERIDPSPQVIRVGELHVLPGLDEDNR